MTAQPIQRTEGSYIHSPDKLMRVAAVARAMLAEARETPCDEAGCERFRAIYEDTVTELSTLLSQDLQRELGHLAVPFLAESPSPSELRVQAELVGWLEGLFSGIAAAAAGPAQGAAAQAAAVADVAGDGPSRGNYLRTAAPAAASTAAATAPWTSLSSGSGSKPSAGASSASASAAARLIAGVMLAAPESRAPRKSPG